MVSREVREQLAKYKKALILEEQQRNKLINKDLDYAYLEQLVKRCENNRDLIIELRLKDGTMLTIKTDRNPVKPRSQEIFEQLEV